jgi:hypothetical protein
MLRIYPVFLEMVRGVRPCVEKIGRFDADLARQLRKASASVALNVAEGSGSCAHAQPSQPPAPDEAPAFS